MNKKSSFNGAFFVIRNDSFYINNSKTLNGLRAGIRGSKPIEG